MDPNNILWIQFCSSIIRSPHFIMTCYFSLCHCAYSYVLLIAQFVERMLGEQQQRKCMPRYVIEILLRDTSETEVDGGRDTLHSHCWPKTL